MKKYIKYAILPGLFMLLFSLFSTEKLVAQTIGFSISNQTVTEKDTFVVALKADSLLTGRGIYAFRFGLSYNSGYVEFLGIDSVGTPLKSWGLPTINSVTAGQINIAGAGTVPLAGKGEPLLYFRFRAIRGGYTYISPVSGYSFLNEGNPAMTMKYGYVNCASISYPDIYPDSKELYVGETVQMSSYGGTAPYTYGSDRPAIASVSSDGKVTALSPGIAKIFTTDAKGNKNFMSSGIDVRGVKLSVVNSGTIIQDTFYLPIRIEMAPGTKVYSGSFELTFNTNLEGIKSNIKTGDYAVSLQNNAVSSLVKISFASATGLTGTGILCQVAMKAVQSGTHTVYIQNVLCNEDLKVFTYSGTVGVECKPCVKPTGLTPEDGTVDLNPSYFDLYWQPSLNAQYYNLFLWEDGTLASSTPYRSYIYGTSTRLYNLTPAKKYHWKIVAVNACSTLSSDEQTFTIKPLPDLEVTNVQAPKEVESGSPFTVSFTVKNSGQTITTGQWRDVVYISTDSSANGGKTQLMVKYNAGQIAVNANYTQSYTITMPSEYSGKYYIFVRTDVYNELAELSDNNNQRRFDDSVKVALKPFPDIMVKDIQGVGTKLIPGDSLLVNWKVQNIGNADALGGWSERITLVTPSGRRVTLSPMLTSSTDLAAGQTLSRSYKFKIPEVLRFSGTANVEVVLYPSSTLVEHSGADANNTAYSTSVVTAVDYLFLDLSTASLSEGSTAEVRCVVTRSGDYTSALTVNLGDNPDGQVTTPANLIIPANSSSEVFILKAIDNSVIEGSRNVNIIVSAASYRNDTSTIQLLDNEATILKAKLDKTTAHEGDSLKLRITRNLVVNQPLTVYLSTDKGSQWLFNNAATIPANDSVVIVPIYVYDDNSPELDGAANITISSGGFISGSVSATILDDDMPELEFKLSADTVQEASGMYATYATIRRISGEGNITLNLTTSPTNTLILPSSITIPNGTSEVRFNIGVVDNGDVDGYRKVDILGSIYVKSCSCNTTPDNGGVITRSLVIADNDGPALTASVNPVSAFEGRSNASKLIINRNTETSKALTVNISYSDASEVQIQTTAVIPAGQKSVEVPINTINDGVEDGNQTVSITVSSAGFVSGFCFVYVTDLNKPDFVLNDVVLSQTTVLTSGSVQISGKLKNNGFLNAPMGSKVGFYLSKDDYVDTNDELLGTFVTSNQILMGDSVSFKEAIVLPSKTGKYKLLAYANPNNAVNELVYTNNTAEPIAVTVVPEYTATAIVDITQVLPNTPITIHGKATKVNSQPARNVSVDVYLLCNGTRKELEALTDADGNYSIVFTPLNNESGHYDVGACYPDEGLTDSQDAFDILGIQRTSTDNIIWMTKVGLPLTGKLIVKNMSNIELKNVQMKIAQLPAGCTLSVSPIATLAGNATAEFNYTVLGTERSKTADYQKLVLTLSSDEGVNIAYNAFYYCQEQQASFETNPASINTTISKGSTKYLEVNLTNNGGGESGIVTVTLPDVDYMGLVSSDTITNIKPSESVTITIKLTDSDLPLNTPVNGNIAINCEHGKGIILPYKLEAVSDAKGNLSIDVIDEYTYNTTEAPHVKNAHVVVRHPFSGVIVAEGFTNANGIFEATNIPEGYYSMTVEATQHDGYRNNIIIDAGKTLTQSIFLSFQAISYTWEVVPTEVEDEYKVDLIMKFETNVPVPVVVMEMPDTMPKLVNDETFPFMVTLTNKGLITAVDLTLKFPDDPEYEFITNFTKMDLLAQQSIQVPVVMKRKASYSPVSGLQRAQNSSLNCFDVVIEAHGFYCGPDKKWHQGVQLFNFAGRVCVGSATGGYSPGGGGGDPSLGGGGTGYVYVVPSSNSSTVSVTNVDECDNCLMDLALTALGCLPGPIGPIMGVVSCIKSFADADGISVMDVVNCAVGFIPGWGCVYGLFQVAISCYQDPPRLFAKPISLPMNAPGAVTKPLMPPILKQAFTDMSWVIHSMNAERAWLRELTGIDSMYTRVNFADFASVVDSFTTYKREIKPLDVISINQKLFGTDILPAEVEAFATRWNNTLLAQSKKIYAPNAEFPDIINNDTLVKYVQQADSSRAYAVERGYTDVREMANTSYNTILDQIETGRKSVCASITLQISQKLVMTREAFEGTLTINNGNTQNAMTNIKLNLEVKNSQGVLCNDLFQINTKALSILTGIDGTGTLAAGQTGSASILFIPEKGAAPQTATTYSFGGTFSYVDPFNGLEVTKDLFPISLEVHPSPDLYLHYFMERDILGDDPLTETIEPIVPAELALMIKNDGYGPATKVRVESAQPEIIENQKGLVIHLALIGSNLNGQTRQLGLTNIDFGNIAAKSTAIGQWWFTSDLLGHFVNYETRVVHANSYGNPDLSLVSGATLHELIRSIVVYNDADTIHDFLVNEVQDAAETPDNIYTSGGVVLPVNPVVSIATSGTLSAPAYEIELQVTPKMTGWNYGKITDPTGGRYKIQSVTRLSDGKVLPYRNVWQTHVTLPDGEDPVYENKIHFADEFATVQLTKYKIKFVPKVTDPPTVKTIENVPASVINTRLTSVRVVFEKPINPSSFTYEDMVLRVQGGDNLMKNTVTVTEVNGSTYDVDLSTVTQTDGYYVLTIQTTGITNTMGESGEIAKQASWSQFTYTPSVQEFVGIPVGKGAAFENMLIRFTVPIDTTSFTSDRLIWTKNGSVVTGVVTITRMDSEAKLFKIAGLNSIMTEDGVYGLTVDLIHIKSKAGVYGAFEKSVQWQIDNQPPVISKIVLNNTGGFDNQHITSIQLKFNEPVVGFEMAAIELWKDGKQQPTSQLNVSKINDSTYLITDFRLLTYYEGDYTLKVNMSNIADSAGNTATGVVEHSWKVNRNVPAAVTDMKISPDLGFSAVDGITSTANVNVTMRVNAPKARIRLYYNSFGSSTLLADTLPASTGLITLPVTIPVTGSTKLEAETVDTLGNTSVTELPVYIDGTPLSAYWNSVPTGILRSHPVSVLLDFSDKIQDESILKNNLICSLNGVPTNAGSLTITKNSETQYAIGNFGNVGVQSGGIFSLAINTANLKKYLSGKAGLQTPATQWTLRGNTAPVANAGADQILGYETTFVVLDGTKSSDADNDLLTYFWTAPVGITLSDVHASKPTFVAPAGNNILTFGLVVNDGIADSQTDEVVVNLIKTNSTELISSDGNLSLFPNPSHNEFVVNVNEPTVGTLKIRIYNNVGQLVYLEDRKYAGKAESYKFSKLSLNSGLYVVEVKIDNKQLGVVKWTNIDK